MLPHPETPMRGIAFLGAQPTDEDLLLVEPWGTVLQMVATFPPPFSYSHNCRPFHSPRLSRHHQCIQILVSFQRVYEKQKWRQISVSVQLLLVRCCQRKYIS